MFRLAAVFLLLGLAACASRRSTAGDVPERHMMLLCVSNESSSAGPIRVWVDEFRALTVGSGKRECHRMPEISSPTRLYAVSTAGGWAGPTRYEGEISNMGIRCWDWVLRDGSTSAIRLVPCDFFAER